jgi:hypothetical protein
VRRYKHKRRADALGAPLATADEAGGLALLFQPLACWISRCYWLCIRAISRACTRRLIWAQTILTSGASVCVTMTLRRCGNSRSLFTSPGWLITFCRRMNPDPASSLNRAIVSDDDVRG